MLPRAARAATEVIARLRIATPSPARLTRYLSGGNQQKVVVGKWFVAGSRFFIFDEPTRGIDVGAKAEIHRLMSELARQGIAILMISSELTEIMGMSDRILVLHEGKLTAEFPGRTTTQEDIMTAATGKTSPPTPLLKERGV